MFVFVALAVWQGRVQARVARRGRLMVAPFPSQWSAILEEHLVPYRKLSEEELFRLHGTTQVFLAEKVFEGCGGLEVTERMRVLIAAQACLLLLNREVQVYPKLRVVLVYPDAYVVGGKGFFDGGEEASVRLGESWDHGTVVLSWNSVREGAENFDDGHNVTLHEFAHQLDQAGGEADGAPGLGSSMAYRTWARVCSAEYERLVSRAEEGRESVMDDYGATNPAEFFAVATETFFEKPRQLERRRPELFEELKRFYRTDPLRWG